MQKYLSQRILAGLLVLALAPCTLFAADVEVTNADNDGAGSLRQALDDADQGDRIVFNIQNGNGPFTITLEEALVVDTNNIEIDGYTQSGASEATDSSAANLQIIVDGDEGAFNGFEVTADNVTIKGLVIQNFNGGPQTSGVEITGNNNTIAGSYIGTDVNGNNAAGNNIGINVAGDNNTIGGDSIAALTLISGNTDNGVGLGALISGNNNTLKTVRIGTNAAGTSAIPNDEGVAIVGASENTIEQALISGNTTNGVRLESTIVNNSNENTIKLSLIGTTFSGASALGNGASGILFNAGNVATNVDNNWVQCNVVAFNGNAGIRNHDGGNSGNGNRFEANSAHSNDESGIQLDNDGNNNQAAPEITNATANGAIVKVTGTVAGVANTRYILEFFSNTSNRNSNGITEGRTFLGRVAATTDNNGDGAFNSVQLLSDAQVGQWVSATAIRAENGDASEYSQNRQLAQGQEQSPLSIAIITKYCPNMPDYCDNI